MLYTNTKLYIKHIKNYLYKYVQIQKDVYEKLYENKKSYDKICNETQKIKKIKFWRKYLKNYLDIKFCNKFWTKF